MKQEKSLNLFLSAQKGVHMMMMKKRGYSQQMSDNVRGEVRRVVINVLMWRRERMCVC